MTLFITFTGHYAITYADGSVRELKRMTAREAYDDVERDLAKMKRRKRAVAFRVIHNAISFYRLPVGQCAFCDANRNEGPSHTPSANCESGKHPHCTCDVCF